MKIYEGQGSRNAQPATQLRWALVGTRHDCLSINSHAEWGQRKRHPPPGARGGVDTERHGGGV